MAFGSNAERRAAFANMNANEIKALKTKSTHYIKDERMAVGEYNQFEKEINDAGLPERLVKKVGDAAKDEHRHMNDMIAVKKALGEKPKQSITKKEYPIDKKHKRLTDSEIKQARSPEFYKTVKGGVTYKVDKDYDTREKYRVRAFSIKTKRDVWVTTAWEDTKAEAIMTMDNNATSGRFKDFRVYTKGD